MKHTNYQPARKGLLDAQITACKVARVRRNGTKAMPELIAVATADLQHSAMRYSDRGDFTRCYRGGFY